MPTGSSGKASVFIKDLVGTWQEFKSYVYFKVRKEQNQVSQFEMKVYDISAAKKLYVKEQAEIMFYAGEEMILKGRIQKVTYQTAYECDISGFGMESVLLDKEFIKNGDKRVEYSSPGTLGATIAKEILSEGSDGSAPWIMEPVTTGIFDTDYGLVSARFEYGNRLKCLAKVAEIIDYDWWVTQDGSYNDYFNLASYQPDTTSATVSQFEFAITSATDDSGTATSGTSTTLTDTSQSWTIDEYSGRYVYITGGTGRGQSRKILSNTATELTVANAFDTTPDNTSTYEIGQRANCWQTGREKDITNMANKIDVLGYGDGINQLHTFTYSASVAWDTLSADITDSATTISLIDASDFPSSGTIRIAEEQITYSGKSGNNLTGCTRGANSTTAYSHKSGVYVEPYNTIDSPEADSSIDEYGLLDYTVVNRGLLDRETAELIASHELIKKRLPIERVKIKPNSPTTIAEERQIGEKITVTDAEAGLSEDFRIVAIEYTSDYGVLDMNLECSNKSLTFIEQMKKEQEENENMQKYMQGSTNIYSINEAENCDRAHPLNMRFFIPEKAISINSTLLNFKMKPYRTYSNPSSTSIANSQATSAILQPIYGSSASWTDMISITTGGDASDGIYLNFGAVFAILSGSNPNINGRFSYRIYDGTRYYPTYEQYQMICGGRLKTYDGVTHADAAMSGNVSLYLPGDHSNKTFTLQMRGSGYPSGTLFEFNLNANYRTISNNFYEIQEETLSTDSVDIYVGEDGQTLSLVDNYTEDTSNIDITNEVAALGSNKWVNVQFVPKGGEVEDSQTETDGETSISSGGPTRAGVRKTVSNRIITKVAFKLRRVGTLTGNAYYRVRKVSDDSVIQEVAFDASTLSGTSTWVEKEFSSPVEINEEVYICAEYANTGGSNYIAVAVNDPGSGLIGEYESEYDGGWIDEPDLQAVYKIYYDISRTRIEANAYVQTFIKSEA